MTAAQLYPDAARVRDHLIALVQDDNPNSPFWSTITYGHLAVAVDPQHLIWKPSRYRGLGQVLGDISRYEHDQGRPLLSGLVVWAGVGRPGPGFFDMARDLGYHVPPAGETNFWKTEMRRIVEYWREHDSEEEGSSMEQIRALLAQAQQSVNQAIAIAQSL